MPPNNGDNDDASQRGANWPGQVPAQPSSYWAQLNEQRMNSMDRALRDVRTDITKVQERQGTAESTSRENGYGIRRLEDMMREMEKTLARMEGLIPDKRRAELVEKVVFGLVGLILVAVVGLWLKTIGIGR